MRRSGGSDVNAPVPICSTRHPNPAEFREETRKYSVDPYGGQSGGSQRNGIQFQSWEDKGLVPSREGACSLLLGVLLFCISLATGHSCIRHLVIRSGHTSLSYHVGDRRQRPPHQLCVPCHEREVLWGV